MDSHNSSDVNADIANLEQLTQDLRRIRDSVAVYKRDSILLDNDKAGETANLLRKITAAAKEIIEKYRDIPMQEEQEKKIYGFTDKIKILNQEITALIRETSPANSPTAKSSIDYKKMIDELLLALDNMLRKLEEDEYLPTREEITAARIKLDKIDGLAISILKEYESTTEHQQQLPENIGSIFADEIGYIRDYIQQLEQDLLEQEEPQNRNEEETEYTGESEDENDSEEEKPSITEPAKSSVLIDDDLADSAAKIHGEPVNTNEQTKNEPASKPTDKSSKDKEEISARDSTPAAVNAKSPTTSAVSPASQEIILQAGKQKAAAKVSADLESQPGSEMVFVCKFVEEQLKNKNPDDPIKIVKCPRKIERALVAYCDYMGYKLDRASVKVKFNTGEKENMIRGFEKLVNESRPDLKKIIDDKKQLIHDATHAVSAKMPEMELVAAAPPVKQERNVVEITPRIQEIIDNLEDIEKRIPEASYLDKQRLERELIDEIYKLNPDELYAITLKLFSDHIKHSTVHLLRSAEGLKKYAYIAFAKKVGYDLKANGETPENAFTLPPDKAYDPRMDVLNWYVRQSMGEDNDNDSVCNNIVFCIIGGVRHNPKADDPRVALQVSMTIESEKKTFLVKGAVRSGYISHVVNHTVKQPEAPVIIQVDPSYKPAQRKEAHTPAPSASNPEKKKPFRKISQFFSEKKTARKTTSSPGLLRKKNETTKSPSDPTTSSKKPNLGRK